MTIGVFGILFVGLIGVAAYVSRVAPEAEDDETFVAVDTTAEGPQFVSEFLDAYERSFVGPYALTGVLEFANDQALTRSRVKRAVIGDKFLDQIGDGAVVGRGDEERLCSNSGSEFLCADPTVTPTLDERREEMRDRVENGAGYRVGRDTNGCFVLSARGDDPSSPLGVETTYCFDQATGAIASRTTSKGRRTESFIANEIKQSVTEEDLAPT